MQTPWAGSLFAEVRGELFSEVVVLSEGGTSCLLLQSWVPVVELIDTVAEAESLIDRQEH